MRKRLEQQIDQLVRFYCDKCDGHVAPVEGVNAIWRRGRWWCMKHARLFDVRGVIEVDFPSEGVLIPSAISTSAKQ